jgi:pimeloyl-ACP methyl ester carboxylesterase
MFDERSFIYEVESADTRRLAQLLSQPSAEQERALRIYFGDPTYERMRELAVQAENQNRGGLLGLNLSSRSRGRVVVIHGIMGAELGRFGTQEASAFDLIWVHLRHIFSGWVEHLRLDEDGRSSPYDVRAVGIMKSFYGELLLRLLNEQWDAHAFWFDWRKDLDVAADELDQKMREWYGDSSPVHIVAHSMGGLVARTWIRKYPARWQGLGDGAGRGRLIMLGTPNYGSFVIPQVITGVEAKVRQLALLDVRHSLEEIIAIVNTFPGSYQMLPSPDILPQMQTLYDAASYGDLNVSQQHLDNAREYHRTIAPIVDDETMIYVAGYNRLTPCNLRDPKRRSSPLDYDVTRLGDGRVTHELGIPRLPDGQPIKHVYYVDEVHGDLPRNKTVIEAVCELLERGTTDLLEQSLPAWLDDGTRAPGDQMMLVKQYADAQEALVADFRELIVRFEDSRGTDSTVAISELDRLVHQCLVGDTPAGVLLSEPSPAHITTVTGRGANAGDTDEQPVAVEIRLAWAFIEDIGAGAGEDASLPIDAISVGHYVGYGKPLMAEQALDDVISRKLLGQAPDAKLNDTEKLLTLYSYRGIIRGELGQPFFIDDPRAPNRLIVLAGMGEAGRFWAPELTVLSRELCWALGRLGKKHLATVLIGAGQGNMQPEEAVAAWLRGIKYAFTGSDNDEWRLKRITFVEADPRKLKAIENAILRFSAAEKEERRTRGRQTLEIKYDKLDFERLRSKKGRSVTREIALRVRRETKEAMQWTATGRADKEQDEVPVRITLSLEGKRYRFGAITKSASVPERETTVDPDLVMEVNDELPAAKEIAEQLAWGKHLRSLLLPKDILPAFSTAGPVVMMLDTTTSCVHWEMLPEPEHFPVAPQVIGAPPDSEKLDSFLSIGRGFTRQLRTSFAPPPEPPPPPRRVLRVLIVADPWAQNRLRGAELEGEEVAALFEAFNKIYKSADNRVEVVKLIGPLHATRRKVHHYLTLQQFDIMHFAGHCKFVLGDPAESGWLFTDGKVLSAYELNRIDNIPKFVFSNACESGVMPERPEGRAAEFAPSFAEAFFARGVANFVCTAWPVSDSAARQFAVTLYSALLGLKQDATKPEGYDRGKPMKMYQAMREARRIVAGMKPQTWGAYQHYGNPYLQFFDESKLTGRDK